MPPIFSPGTENQRRKWVMSWRQKPRKPRLERSYAIKNIDYIVDPSSSGSSNGCSTSSSWPSPAAALRGTRSLDLSPHPTSFRVGGESDGELDSLLQRLNISSSDELGISMTAWEERKKRCSSELLPRSRLYHPLQSNSSPPTANSDIQTSNCNENKEVCELLALEAEDRAYDDDGGSGGDIVRVRTGGIKGVRPPLLDPPPPTLKPWANDDCANSSTWDILKSFGPNGSHVNQGEFFSEYDDCIGEIASIRRIGETVVLSESCSFTASSNDDDSSSTTTEHTSHVSPNGRFKHVITSWQKGDLLGRGSFGSVYEGIADDGFFIAVKQVSLLEQGDQGKQSVIQLEQEIALLSQFEHENIVQYYGTDKDESNLYIFLELVTKGSLLSLYQKYILRDSSVSSYTRQILHGLRYLHSRNVVHRDIKCANILVDASGSVKLADFGLAKATKLNDVKSCKGTAFWMAPEVVHRRNQGYGLAADIWSLGCTVLEMLTRQLPYYPLECMAALFRIGNSIPPPVPDSLSKEARDFILQCLQVNPNNRPTAAQLLDHPFVKRPFIYPPALASPHSYGWRS